MRNEQIHGKNSKASTPQSRNTGIKKNTAMSFISFVMKEVITPDLDQNNDPGTNEANQQDAVTMFDDTDLPCVQLTVFQLSEEEILKEMLTHLAADCPTMMQNKERLITQISSQYDNLKDCKPDPVMGDYEASSEPPNQ